MPVDQIEAWHSWHREFLNLLDGRFRNGRLNVFMPPSLTQSIGGASRLLRNKAPTPTLSGDTETLSIPSYAGCCPVVQRLAKLFKRDPLRGNVIGIVHGSVGTEETVAYSDFDGLVIFREHVFDDALVLGGICKTLIDAQRYIFDHDPLQHHGWFALPESALQFWPQHYLPTAALAHSKVFSQDDPRQFVIRPLVNGMCLQSMVQGLTQRIDVELETFKYLRGMTQLKSLLSKLMLLPALYVQARDCRGVFKADSFGLAQEDFSEAEWQCVRLATSIRKIWPNLSPRWPKWIYQSPTQLGLIARRRFGYSIPHEIASLLNETFHSSALSFTARVLESLPPNSV